MILLYHGILVAVSVQLMDIVESMDDDDVDDVAS